MKDKILKEIIEWCEQQEENPEFYMDDFVEIVIDRTAHALFEEIKSEMKKEFESGNLKHPFIISDEYYLYLKLKEIKNKFIKADKDEDFTENEEKEI